MKSITCILALFLAVFILGCSENKEITTPQTPSNQNTVPYYLCISPVADDYEANVMPFAGYCDVYKSTDQINWVVCLPFSWEEDSWNYGKYDLWPNTYYKWQGHNEGQNEWQTTTRWYSYHQSGDPTDDVRELCTFYKQ